MSLSLSLFISLYRSFARSVPRSVAAREDGVWVGTFTLLGLALPSPLDWELAYVAHRCTIFDMNSFWWLI